MSRINTPVQYLSHQEVMGDQRPRIECLPVYKSSVGQEICELSAASGLMLDDWQQYVIHNAMGKRDDDTWAAFEVLLIVSRQNGKSAIFEARCLGGMYLLKEELIIYTAHEFKTAEEVFRRVLSLMQNTPELDRRIAKIRTSHGEEGIELLGGQRLRFLARSRSSARGFTGDCLFYDEAMILDSSAVGASLPTLSARPNPQVWYGASAGMKNSTQLAAIRRRMIAGDSPDLMGMEWSIDPHDEYCPPNCIKHDDSYTVKSYAKSNPALGIRISLDHIKREREAMSGNLIEFDRERLGVGEYPAPSDGWLVIPEKWYKATADHTQNPPILHNVIFAIDMPPDRTYATIGVAGYRPDERVGIEIVEHRPGTKWIVSRAVELQKKWHPAKWIVDPRSAAGALIDDLIGAGIPVEKVSAQDVAHACGQFFDGMRDDWLWHLDQPVLRAALAGADKRPLSEAWAWDRKNAAANISPLVAVTLAVWGFLKFGKDSGYSIADSVHFDSDEIVRLAKAGVYDRDDLKRLRDRGLLDDDTVDKLKSEGIGVSL